MESERDMKEGKGIGVRDRRGIGVKEEWEIEKRKGL